MFISTNKSLTWQQKCTRSRSKDTQRKTEHGGWRAQSTREYKDAELIGTLKRHNDENLGKHNEKQVQRGTGAAGADNINKNTRKTRILTPRLHKKPLLVLTLYVNNSVLLSGQRSTRGMSVKLTKPFLLTIGT